MAAPHVAFLSLFLQAVVLCSAKVDFCADNRLPSSNLSSKLQFTKELSDWEYAVQSKFKSLHCCAKGYRFIEWFKDGRAYPWPGDSSSLILYPESANQTIYTQHLKPTDGGNYTCRIHNDTHQLRHNTQLTVFDTTGYMEKPLATYRPAAVSKAFLGQQARLFCEAFVGHISLPDASSEVIWTKMGNESFMDSRMHLEHVQREGAQIVGAYLIIEDVQSTDFGTYLCTISNTGDQKIVMTTRLESWRDPSPPLFLWRGVVTILFCTSLTIVGLVLVIYTFKLISKENRVVSSILGKILEKSPFADSTPKKLGLVLLYGDEDAGIVESSVIPELKEKYSYNVFPQKLTSEGTVSDESKELINKVGRVMVVLTEKVVKEWTEFNVVSALQKIIPPQQHCILTAEPSPENFGNQQSQRGNFDFEKYIERYKVVMWSGDSGESKNELSSPSQGDKPADNSLQPPPVDERRKDAKSFLAKVHLTRSKKEPSPEAHV